MDSLRWQFEHRQINRSRSEKYGQMRSIFFWTSTRMVLNYRVSIIRKGNLFYHGWKGRNPVYISALQISMVLRQVLVFSTRKMGLACWQMPPHCQSFAA